MSKIPVMLLFLSLMPNLEAKLIFSNIQGQKDFLNTLLNEIEKSGSTKKVKKESDDKKNDIAKYKADIVVADEKEGGMRKLLNLGHTIGHAIEKKSNFTLPHGAAVIKGILYIAKGAVKHGSLQKEALDTIIEICKMYQLDYSLDTDVKDLINEISSDKKMHADGSISFIDIEALGLCKVKKTTIKGLEEYIL